MLRKNRWIGFFVKAKKGFELGSPGQDAVALQLVPPQLYENWNR